MICSVTITSCFQESTVMIGDLCWHLKSITITLPVLFIEKLWLKKCNLVSKVLDEIVFMRMCSMTKLIQPLVPVVGMAPWNYIVHYIENYMALKVGTRNYRNVTLELMMNILLLPYLARVKVAINYITGRTVLHLHITYEYILKLL